MEQLGAARAARFGQSKEAGSYRRCRVHYRRQMSVVVFEHVGTGRVEEGGVKRVAALGATDDPGLGWSERR
jgi:hypothetical protein